MGTGSRWSRQASRALPQCVRDDARPRCRVLTPRAHRRAAKARCCWQFREQNRAARGDMCALRPPLLPSPSARCGRSHPLSPTPVESQHLPDSGLRLCAREGLGSAAGAINSTTPAGSAGATLLRCIGGDTPRLRCATPPLLAARGPVAGVFTAPSAASRIAPSAAGSDRDPCCRACPHPPRGRRHQSPGPRPPVVARFHADLEGAPLEDL